MQELYQTPYGEYLRNMAADVALYIQATSVSIKKAIALTVKRIPLTMNQPMI